MQLYIIGIVVSFVTIGGKKYNAVCVFLTKGVRMKYEYSVDFLLTLPFLFS